MSSIIIKNSGISLKYTINNTKIRRLKNDLKYLEKTSSDNNIIKICHNSIEAIDNISPKDINQFGFIRIPFNDDKVREIVKTYISNILSSKNIKCNDMICTQVSQSFNSDNISDNDISSYDTYFPYLYTQVFSFVDKYLNNSFYNINASSRKLTLGIIFNISILDDDRYVFSPNLYILHNSSGVSINIKEFETKLYGSIIPFYVSNNVWCIKDITPSKNTFKFINDVYTIDDLKKIYSILNKDI